MSSDAIEQKIDVAIDRATIYRVLNRFCEDGLVHKIIERTESSILRYV
ncbi:Fur family transcriptional regulator, ferric uptake regulator [Flexibacter flexilis DSM 6793]|uniref:Fur family transcriptional regulator, ferric uptake regulator n=1 Tax=Flexibacter flexilis DSM 6793 TaxID=927664 RepID=A0A1I1DC64_9BACT|nr:Fur family transcriptional regulator, ferric uptake regulator [Flexibacter flexilis DSM 6793]